MKAIVIWSEQRNVQNEAIAFPRFANKESRSLGRHDHPTESKMEIAISPLFI